MGRLLRHQRYSVANLMRDSGRISGERRRFGPNINFMDFGYDFDFGGKPVKVHNLSNGPVEDLSVCIYVRSDYQDLRIDIDGNPDRYSQADLVSFQQRLIPVLDIFSPDPDRAIGGLEILSPQERHTLLETWNDTAQPLRQSTLPELFAAQVLRTPEAIAVVHEDESLTYRELDLRANQLARHLRGLGVGPETIVGLCVQRSLNMLVGLLGILKAGGAYLPLDPDYPAERLAFMLRDAAAPVLITQSELRPRLPGNAAQLVCLDSDWPAIARQPTSAPLLHLQPQNPAYVIYTSGSTGIPKGVTVTHQGIPNVA